MRTRLPRLSAGLAGMWLFGLFVGGCVVSDHHEHVDTPPAALEIVPAVPLGSEPSILPAASAVTIDDTGPAWVAEAEFDRPQVPEVEVAPPDEEVEEVDFSFFDEALDPHGDWIEVDGLQFWQPRVAVADPHWRPYCDQGRWIYTDWGWTWHSDYTWGWAPFHYGRWRRHGELGWLWLPGAEWAPAWVEWRCSDTYYGWAPLPPVGTLGFVAGSPRWSFDFSLTAHDYTFVRSAVFLSWNLRPHCVPRSRLVHVHNTTPRMRNNHVLRNRILYNRGPSRDRVARATRSRINAYRVAHAPRGRGRPVGSHRLRDRTLEVYRPRVVGTPLHRPGATRSRDAQTPEDRNAVNRLSTRRARTQPERTGVRAALPRPPQASRGEPRPVTTAATPRSFQPAPRTPPVTRRTPRESTVRATTTTQRLVRREGTDPGRRLPAARQDTPRRDRRPADAARLEEAARLAQELQAAAEAARVRDERRAGERREAQESDRVERLRRAQEARALLARRTGPRHEAARRIREERPAAADRTRKADELRRAAEERAPADRLARDRQVREAQERARAEEAGKAQEERARVARRDAQERTRAEAERQAARQRQQREQAAADRTRKADELRRAAEERNRAERLARDRQVREAQERAKADEARKAQEERARVARERQVRDAEERAKAEQLRKAQEARARRDAQERARAEAERQAARQRQQREQAAADRTRKADELRRAAEQRRAAQERTRAERLARDRQRSEQAQRRERQNAQRKLPRKRR